MIEALDTLDGKGPEDFKEVVFALGSLMLQLSGRAVDEKEACALMEGVIADGSAKKKFAEFIEAQGGDPAPVFDPSLLAVAETKIPVIADKDGYVHRILAEEIGIACMSLGGGREKDGYVHRILAEEIGIACMSLGGGRETKESEIDLSVGIVLQKKNGDAVAAGDTLAVIYGNDEEKLTRARERVAGAYEILDEPVKKQPVIRKYIFSE